MSDAPQGSDWWQASDGKWYPPQPPAPPPPPPPGAVAGGVASWPPSVPGAAPPGYPPPPPTPLGVGLPGTAPRWVSNGLSGTLQGFLWAAGGLSLVGAVLAVVGRNEFVQWRDAPSGSRAESRALDDMTSADEAINAVVSTAGLAGFVVFILLLVWSNQAHKATQQLAPGPRTWSSGWTVGAWFIPLANAVIPKLVLNEIERIALTPRSGGIPTADWRGRSTSVVGWFWWLLFVGGFGVGSVGYGMFDEPSGTMTSWHTGYVLTAVGYGALAVSSVCGALYVRRIGRALSWDAMNGQPWSGPS